MGHELSAADPSANLDFGDWVQKNIIAPLNMKGTGVGLNVSSNRDAAWGYAPNGKPVAPYRLGWNVPCGGMRSTARDLATFAHAIMAGKLLRSDTLAREMVDPVTLDSDGTTLFGTPWEMYFHNKTGFLVRRKGGNVPGYSALLAFVPELELSLSILFGGSTSEFDASQAAFDLLLPAFSNLMLRLEYESGPVRQPENNTKYVGQWESEFSTVHISVFNGTTLYLRMTGSLGIGLFLRIPDWQSAPSSSVLQLWVPRTIAACFNLELEGYLYQYVIFSDDMSTLTIPGLLPGLTWTRH